MSEVTPWPCIRVDELENEAEKAKMTQFVFYHLNFNVYIHIYKLRAALYFIV